MQTLECEKTLFICFMGRGARVRFKLSGEPAICARRQQSEAPLRVQTEPRL